MNLIGNAVEACEKVNGKKCIEVNVLYERDEINIIIRNTMNEDIRCENGNLKTTKKDEKNHGIGIKNIKEVVEKYSGIYLQEIGKDIFETVIIL